MRERSIREGSVGLLILIAVALLVVWCCGCGGLIRVGKATRLFLCLQILWVCRKAPPCAFEGCGWGE